MKKFIVLLVLSISFLGNVCFGWSSAHAMGNMEAHSMTANECCEIHEEKNGEARQVNIEQQEEFKVDGCTFVVNESFTDYLSTNKKSANWGSKSEHLFILGSVIKRE